MKPTLVRVGSNLYINPNCIQTMVANGDNACEIRMLSGLLLDINRNVHEVAKIIEEGQKE